MWITLNVKERFLKQKKVLTESMNVWKNAKKYLAEPSQAEKMWENKVLHPHKSCVSEQTLYKQSMITEHLRHTDTQFAEKINT